MNPRKHAIWAMTVFALLAHAGVMQAQIVGPQSRERYERRTKGTSIDDFVKKLSSDEPEERLQAVRSLGESQEPKAIEYLIQAVGDDDVRVRAKAIAMLGHMKATEATPVLIQYLFLRTTDPKMKTLVLASLGKIGDQHAAKPILDFLQRDLDQETRGTAIFALGEIGSSDAEKELTKISQTAEDPTLRRLATEALAKVHYRQASRSAEAKEPSATFLEPNGPPPAR